MKSAPAQCALMAFTSTTSATVAQRTGEFGIRMALGARREHVLLIVYKSTVGSLSCGITAGLFLALAFNRIVAHWAGASVRDPMILAPVTLLLGLVAAFACAFPAYRASRVDPAVALRS
jgi:ABC-type antimicrobial peptide transport system permease subunit